MYFYSRNNFINDFLNIAYSYIVYFLFVLARKSKFTFFSHKVFQLCITHLANAVTVYADEWKEGR